MTLNRGYKYLFTNILLFGISALGTKIMAYIILPLYTSKVTSTEYGIIDMINVTVSLLVPLLSICISDWLLRYATEDKKNIKKCFSICLEILFISTIVLILFYPLLKQIKSIENVVIYLIIGYFFVTANQIISYVLRALDKVFLVAVSGIITSLITIIFNFIYIKFSTLSIDSYFICQYLGILISLVIVIVSGKLYKYFSILKVEKNDIAEIVNYCIPLIPNSLFWWINSSIDKYTIISILGISSSGLYGAASKIPSLLTIFSTIFQQAWNLLLFQKKKTNDYSMEKKVFLIYHDVLILGSIFIVLLSKFFASILLQGVFFEAWILIPMLVVSFLFTTLSTFVGSFFTANKNTKPLFTTSMYSALINVILNILLINLLGLFGAAIATMISGFINYILRVRLAMKEKYIQNILFNKKNLIYMLLIILSMSYQFFNVFEVQILISFLICSFVIFELRKEIKTNEIS